MKSAPFSPAGQLPPLRRGSEIDHSQAVRDFDFPAPACGGSEINRPHAVRDFDFPASAMQGKRNCSPGARPWMFVDHAGAAHFLNAPIGVRYDPVTSQQPRRRAADVGNLNGITAQETVIVRCRLLIQKARLHCDADGVGIFVTHVLILGQRRQSGKPCVAASVFISGRIQRYFLDCRIFFLIEVEFQAPHSWFRSP